MASNTAGTYVGTFHAVMKKYPHKVAADVLNDLVATTPGDEGKWFVAAKDAGLFDAAIALASRTPCNPKTLANAARDHASSEPAFAVNAGLLALHWFAQGFGYELMGADVVAAYDATMSAAANVKLAPPRDFAAEVRQHAKRTVGVDTPAAEFVRRVIGKQLGP